MKKKLIARRVICSYGTVYVPDYYTPEGIENYLSQLYKDDVEIYDISLPMKVRAELPNLVLLRISNITEINSQAVKIKIKRRKKK